MHDHVNRIRNRAFTHAAEVLKTGLTESAGSIEEELDNALADLALTVRSFPCLPFDAPRRVY